MALNITFDGFVYDNDSALGNANINYQALFYPNGTSSSSTTWNDVRTVENTGYYNINLGDGDWLGQEGSALTNSKVIIVFWKGTPLGTDRNALCDVLEEWGAFELTLDGSSVYTNNAQVRENITPVLNWSHNVPSHGYVNTTYSTTMASYDVHSWTFGSVDMYHWRTRYGENIQLINTVMGTNYYWGDGDSDTALPPESGASHQWTSAGTYTIEAQTFDTCVSGITSGTDDVNIYWHAPNPGITRCDSGGSAISGNTIYPPDTQVYFKFDGTDTDSTITSIDWVINDSGAYGNTNTISGSAAVGDVIAHTNGQGTSWDGHTATPGAFTNPGSHNISITVHWYDGHSAQTSTYDENFTQSRFNGPPSANITCNEASGQNIETPDTVVSFIYSGTNPDSRITDIDWVINDTGSYGNTNTSVTAADIGDTILHTNGLGTSWDGHAATPGAFTNPGTHNIEIAVHWNDGWDDNTVNYDENFYQLRFDGPPDPDLVCNEASGQNITTPDTVVSFDYTGNNPDSRITGIDWIIEDTGSYGNTNTTINNVPHTDTVHHTSGLGTDWCGHNASSGAFTNPGTHNVSIEVYWNDGWDDNSITHDENFNQQLFSGPTVSFVQDPAEAPVGEPASFTNTSTNTSRVGLGLPDCVEYNWELDDSGTITQELDKPYEYKFTPTAYTASAEVTLCAEWSDGWETHKDACDSDAVVFKTTVTVTEEDCYYNLNIIGTSSDGSISGYGWVVSSGISDTGPWTEIWSSPQGMDQQDKKLCFTSVGWYQIVGTVYGSGSSSSDDEIMYVDQVCEPGEDGDTISVCPPSMYGRDIDDGKRMRAIDVRPSLRGRVSHHTGNPVNTFPKPTNL